MARLRAGILGNVRGKVAGVVGAQWKNINYIREYVKPANPRTAAQTAQRDKMADIVAFAKPIVGPVFNAYTDRFQKHMSGFNFFIKQWISEFDGTPQYHLLTITEGKLSNVICTAAVYTTGTGEVDCAFDENYGNNGAQTDQVFLVAYNKTTGLWYFTAAEVDRDAGTIAVTLPTGLTATDIQTYLITARYSNTLVTLIANSFFKEGEAA